MCFRETHSHDSRASKIYGYKTFQNSTLTRHATVINSGRAALLNTAHTVGCAVELPSALTAATILANAADTPAVSEMTYNLSSGTLNHTQPTNLTGAQRRRTEIAINAIKLLSTVAAQHYSTPHTPWGALWSCRQR